MAAILRKQMTLPQRRKLALSLLSASLMLAFSPAHAVQQTLDVATAGTQLTYSTVISGADSVLKIGLGILAFTGENTYTGGTTISAGTLQIGANSTTGSIVGNIVNNGVLSFYRSNDLSFAGIASGSGSLWKRGGGTLTLTGTNTYTGGTTVLTGTLQVGSGGTTGSIVGNVMNNAVLSFNRSDNLSFAGNISGSGSLTKSGAGWLTLTGLNNYTGGTTLSAGTLQIGSGGTTGSIFGNVTNNAELVFNRSDNTTFGGVVSGSGKLTKAGTGTLTLIGNNTYSGGTTISNGTLILGAGANAGNIAGNVNISSNATLRFVTTSNTFDGAISGGGMVWKDGAGTLALTGNNTYSGGTLISAGTLQIGSGGTTGSIFGNVTNNASLVFNRSDNTTFAGAVSGSGNLTKLGANTLTLTGANTYVGGTTIQGGALQIGNGTTTGDIVGNIANSGTLVFNRSNSSSFYGVISGAGSLTKLGAGTLTLTGASTHSGGTTIQAGTLQIGNGSTLGSIAGNVVNHGSLAFNRADNTTFSGSVGGSGSLTKLGTSTLTLTGSNTYVGGTTIQGGTLRIGSGGTTGIITGNIVNNGILAFDHSVSTSFAGLISGSGSLTKTGGVLALTGDNTYIGGTTIQSGTLQVGTGGTTGSIVGNVYNNGVLSFVRSDDTSFAGSISGSGSVNIMGSGTLTMTGNNTYTGTTTIYNGGTLQIGNGGTTGWVAGGFSGGTVIFNRSDDIATNKSIYTTLVKQGAGTLTYTGEMFGNVLVSSGTFQIGDGGTRGAFNANITNNAAVVFNRSNDTLFGSYTMSGSGSMTKLGAGKLTLTGSNTYTGGTTISAGTLQIGLGSTYGSIVGNVTNNAALVFNRSDSSSFAGAISGSGSMTKLGAGMLTLGGTSTYTGGTSLSGGTLKLDGSLNGTSGVSLAAGTTLETDADAGIALGGTGARMDVAGVLTPGGAGAGQLNLALGVGGKLGFAAGSILSFDLGATPDLIAFDQVGDWLDGSGNATLQLSAVDYGQTYTVFRNTSTQNFMLTGITGYDSTNYTANFFQSGDDYNLSFSAAVPVPEAQTYALMLAGLGLIGWRTRRRG